MTRQTLAEDAADLGMFVKRRREPNLDFEDFLVRLRRSGKIYSGSSKRGR